MCLRVFMGMHVLEFNYTACLYICETVMHICVLLAQMYVFVIQVKALWLNYTASHNRCFISKINRDAFGKHTPKRELAERTKDLSAINLNKLFW